MRTTASRSGAAALTVAAALAGCGSKQAGGDRALLSVNAATPPRNLDVSQALAVTDTMPANFYVRLVDERDGKIVPWLAKRWTISKDRRTYKFQLRPGLTFKGGAPVDAAAVKYSFDRGLKQPVSSYFLSDGQVGNVVSVTAPSSKKVVIRLKEADSSILSAWAAPPAVIYDPAAVKKDPNVMKRGEAGSGPFELVSYSPQKQLVIKPRASYERWAGKKNRARRVTVNFVSSDTKLLLDARSGAADVTYGMSKRSVKSVADNPKVTLKAAPAGGVQKLLLMWYHPPFDKVEVRHAIALALPYQRILDTAAQGYGSLINGPLQPGMKFYSGSAKPPATDIAQAKQLLSDAGVKTPLKVELTTLANNAEAQQIATVVQASLKPIGVDVKISPLTSGAFTDAEYGFKLQAAIEDDGPAVGTPPFLLGYTMKCEDPTLGPNIQKMCIPEADKLIDAATRSADDSERKRLYGQITDLWQRNWSWIPLYGQQDVTVLRKGVTGYVHYPHYLDLRNIARGGT